jgi:hypothetical protein
MAASIALHLISLYAFLTSILTATKPGFAASSAWTAKMRRVPLALCTHAN